MKNTLHIIGFILYFSLFFTTVTIAQNMYNCDDVENDPAVWMTSFNIYSQDELRIENIDSLELDGSILPNSAACFIYTEDTLKIVDDITFNFQHNLTNNQQVYDKIWRDLNEDNTMNSQEMVFFDSTTTNNFSGNFTLSDFIIQNQFMPLSCDTMRFLGNLRVAVGTNPSNLDQTSNLLLILEQQGKIGQNHGDRPLVTIGSDGNQPENIGCYPLTNPLLFDILNNYGFASHTITSITIALIPIEGDIIYTEVIVFDYLDALDDSICEANTCPYDFIPTEVELYNRLVVGIRLEGLENFDPSKLDKVEITVEIDDRCTKFNTFYFDCCNQNGENIIYYTPTNEQAEATWLPYFTAGNNSIEIVYEGEQGEVAIYNNQEVYLKAENYIRFLPNSRIEAGASVHVYIDTCRTTEINHEFTSIVTNPPSTIKVKNKKNEIIPDSPITLEYFPNPFHHQGHIKYNLLQEAIVNIVIYNIVGQSMDILLDNELQNKGFYELDFYPSNLPNGIYFLALTANNDTHFLRIVKQ